MSEYHTNSVVDPLTTFANRMAEEAGDGDRADKQLAATVGESLYKLIMNGQGSTDLSEDLGHGAMGCEVGDAVIAIIPPMFEESSWECRYAKKEGVPDRYIDVGTKDPGQPIPGKTLGIHTSKAPTGELGPLGEVPTYEGVRGGRKPPDDPQRNAFEDDPPEDDDPFNLGSFKPEDPDAWKAGVDPRDIDPTIGGEEDVTPPGGPASHRPTSEENINQWMEDLSEEEIELTPEQSKEIDDEIEEIDPEDPDLHWPGSQPPGVGMTPPEESPMFHQPAEPRKEPPGPIGMPIKGLRGDPISHPDTRAYKTQWFSAKDGDVQEAMRHDHNLHDIEEKDLWETLQQPDVIGASVPNAMGGTSAHALYRIPSGEDRLDIISASVDSQHPNALHKLFDDFSWAKSRTMTLHVPADKAANWLPHLARWQGAFGTGGWDWKKTGREDTEGYYLTHDPRSSNVWGYAKGEEYAKWNMEGGQSFDPHDPEHQATVYPPINVGAPRVLSTEIESGGQDLIAEGRFGDQDIDEILEHLAKNVFGATSDLRQQAGEVPRSQASSLKEFLESAEVRPQQHAKAGDRKLSKDGMGVLIKHTGGRWNRARDARGKYFKLDDASTMIPKEKAGEIDDTFMEDVLAGLRAMLGPQKNAMMDSGEEAREEHHVPPPHEEELPSEMEIVAQSEIVPLSDEPREEFPTGLELSDPEEWFASEEVIDFPKRTPEEQAEFDADAAQFYQDIQDGIGKIISGAWPVERKAPRKGREYPPGEERHHIGPPSKFSKELAEGLRKIWRSLEQ